MVHFGEFLQTCSLRSNSVTRQVSFNRTKIGEKFDISGDFQTLCLNLPAILRRSIRLLSNSKSRPKCGPKLWHKGQQMHLGGSHSLRRPMHQGCQTRLRSSTRSWLEVILSILVQTFLMEFLKIKRKKHSFWPFKTFLDPFRTFWTFYDLLDLCTN